MPEAIFAVNEALELDGVLHVPPGMVKLDTIADREQIANITRDARASLIVQGNLNASVDPTINDDISEGYYIGSRWFNMVGIREWVCFDSADGAADWQLTTGGGGGDTPTWGGIIGTLSDQADLQGELDAITTANTGDEVQATESVAGIAEIATQGETDAGLDDQRMVTPLKLATLPLSGDVTGALGGSLNVGDDSHSHGDSTIDGLDASAVTTGQFADAQVSATSVSQHDTEIAQVVHLAGLHTNRPTAVAAGAGVFWTSTDLNGGTTFRSNGTTWDQIGAGVNDTTATDLGWDASTKVVSSSTGDDATLTDVDVTNSGLMSSADKTKLNAITGTNTGDEPSATTTQEGVVELATVGEVDAGTDNVRAVTPAGIAGSTYLKYPLILQNSPASNTGELSTNSSRGAATLHDGTQVTFIYPCWTAAADPGTADDNFGNSLQNHSFGTGSTWVNTTSDAFFVCVDGGSVGNDAVWKKLGLGSNIIDFTPLDTGWSVTNLSGRVRTIDTDSTSIDIIADVLGSLILQNIDYGMLGGP